MMFFSTLIPKCVYAHPEMYTDYIFVVTGRSGPTGKTTTVSQLRALGLNAIDVSENINQYVMYADHENHYEIHDTDKTVVITLNELVSERL